MQQSDIEHPALIWTRPSNSIRARGIYDAAYEPGYMSAPNDASKSASKFPLAQGAVKHVAQIGWRPIFPFPETHFAYRFRDRYAERRIAVHDGNADVDFRDLPLKVPCHEALPQQFNARHPVVGKTIPRIVF